MIIYINLKSICKIAITKALIGKQKVKMKKLIDLKFCGKDGYLNISKDYYKNIYNKISNKFQYNNLMYRDKN